ncbi:MAG: hypothetical protein HY674_07075 [Chloroflexi bacterium]|nr:hypothetical protein [Chloroflexota bacterium]
MPRLRRFLRTFKLFFAAPTAALLEEGAGTFEFLSVAQEAGAVEVDVGQVQALMAALGKSRLTI